LPDRAVGRPASNAAALRTGLAPVAGRGGGPSRTAGGARIASDAGGCARVAPDGDWRRSAPAAGSGAARFVHTRSTCRLVRRARATARESGGAVAAFVESGNPRARGGPVGLAGGADAVAAVGPAQQGPPDLQ